MDLRSKQSLVMVAGLLAANSDMVKFSAFDYVDRRAPRTERQKDRANATYLRQVEARKVASEHAAYNANVNTRQVRRNRARLAAKGRIDV